MVQLFVLLNGLSCFDDVRSKYCKRPVKAIFRFSPASSILTSSGKERRYGGFGFTGIRSPIGKACAYTLNHWAALMRYLDDGRLAIDNNLAERAIRPLVVGRNNWLFAGSRRGGAAAATLYSLIQSAKRHGIDPFAYLRDLLTRIPTHPNSRIDELFPDRWKELAQEGQ